VVDPNPRLEEATFIAFDTETTGLYPVAGRLVEIGGVRFAFDRSEVAVFEQLIDPEMSIPPDAQAVNQISDDMVRGMPTVDRVLPSFIDFLGSPANILLAHNAAFDLEFIGVDMLRLGLPLPGHATVDTCTLARTAVPNQPSYALQSLGVMLGQGAAQRHRALADARLTRDVFLALIRRLPGVKTAGDLVRLVPPFSFEVARAYLAAAPEGFEALGGAIARKQTVTIDYDEGGGGPGPRIIVPRAVLRSGPSIYLAAYSHTDHKEMIFRFDRIRALL
jgi:DNA polymerase-3 subunit epsilon